MSSLVVGSCSQDQLATLSGLLVSRRSYQFLKDIVKVSSQNNARMIRR